jgi:hypothetical protein
MAVELSEIPWGEAFPLGVKRSELESDDSPTYNALKNGHSYVFMV